jgi:hypothetical protein
MLSQAPQKGNARATVGKCIYGFGALGVRPTAPDAYGGSKRENPNSLHSICYYNIQEETRRSIHLCETLECVAGGGEEQRREARSLKRGEG